MFLRGRPWHSYSCGQTVGWIKMPLGKDVGLSPGHIVLDGDPVGTQPPTAAPPHFRPMLIVAKRSPISATAELLLQSSRSRQTDHRPLYSVCNNRPHLDCTVLQCGLKSNCYIFVDCVIHP